MAVRRTSQSGTRKRRGSRASSGGFADGKPDVNRKRRNLVSSTDRLLRASNAAKKRRNAGTARPNDARLISRVSNLLTGSAVSGKSKAQVLALGKSGQRRRNRQTRGR